MAEYVVEDVEEDAGEVEEDTSEEVMEEAVVHIKMGLTSQTSPVNFKMHSGTHSQTRQEKG